MFTARRLERSYDRAWYLTQRRPSDQHQEFIAALDEATRDCEAVDVYLLAHTNSFIDWARELPPAQTRKLRLVYNTGCWNVAQGDGWLSLGADAYVGHPGASASPVFYYYFLRRWTADMPLRTSVEASWLRARKVLEYTSPLYAHLQSLPQLLAETEPQFVGDESSQITRITP
jgi:hypothetical protein